MSHTLRVLIVFSSLTPAFALAQYRDWLASTNECRYIGIGEGENASVVKDVSWNTIVYHYGIVKGEQTHRAYLKIANSGVFGIYNLDLPGLPPILEYNVEKNSALCDTTGMQRPSSSDELCTYRLENIDSYLKLIQERRHKRDDLLAWNVLSCLRTLFSKVSPN